MALNFSTVPLHTKHPSFLIPNHKRELNRLCSSQPWLSSSGRAAALSEGTEGSATSARAQLDLLQQLTSSGLDFNGYESDGGSSGLSIRDQLAKLFGERDDDFSVPLGKNLKKFTPKVLTISQKRNIKRQAYLNEVSRRNDSVFFATIGAFVILPPIIILGIAIATGYVQLFP
nr:uncharacterized protein LOC109150617 [Ipomoea batatas]